MEHKPLKDKAAVVTGARGDLEEAMPSDWRIWGPMSLWRISIYTRLPILKWKKIR